MTHLESTKALLDALGVAYRTEYTKSYTGADLCTFLTVEVDDEKVHGYSSFYTDFVFYKDGSFKEMGIWE